MSTITIARKNGSVAIAADSLVKYGYTKLAAQYRRGGSKLVRAGKNRFGVVGYSVWSIVLARYLDSLDEAPRLDSADALFRFTCKMHRKLKGSYFHTGGRAGDEFEQTGLTAVLANPYGIFSIGSDRCITEYARFFAVGAGYRFALGAMYAAYGSDASAEEVARVGVEAAAEFDEDTGLPIEAHTVRLKRRARDAAATENGWVAVRRAR